MIPAIALTLGWRWAFILAGIAGFVWLLLWFPIYDVPEKQQAPDARPSSHYIHSDTDEAAAGGRPMGWLRALRLPQTWSFVARASS